MVKLVVSYEVDGFEHMYELGKEAYLNEEWTYCAKFMEAAVKDYREHQVKSATIMFFQHELPTFETFSGIFGEMSKNV